MSASVRVQFSLLIEGQDESLARARSAENSEIGGPSCLRLDVPADLPSQLSPGPDGGFRLTQEFRNGPPFTLEVVRRGLRTELVLVSAKGHRATINGLIAPRVAQLAHGDLLLLDDAPQLLRVVRRRCYTLGPPPAEFFGKPCPVCRVLFDADTRVYLCDCGQPMHAEGPEKKAEDRLECARVKPLCPGCDQAVKIGRSGGQPDFAPGWEVDDE